MPEMKLPVWAQVVGGVWALLAVAFFLRQIMIAYLTALGLG
jgi:hypothetical protein